MTKKKALLFFAAALILICAVLFFISHRTALRFNDWTVLGSSADEVKAKYGSFDREYGSTKGYYIGDDDSPVMPSHQPQYYWIKFDKNGTAKEVYVQTLPGG